MRDSQNTAHRRTHTLGHKHRSTHTQTHSAQVAHNYNALPCNRTCLARSLSPSASLRNAAAAVLLSTAHTERPPKAAQKRKCSQAHPLSVAAAAAAPAAAASKQKARTKRSRMCACPSPSICLLVRCVPFEQAWMGAVISEKQGASDGKRALHRASKGELTLPILRAAVPTALTAAATART